MRRWIFASFILLLLGIGFTILAQDDEDEDPIMQLSVAGVTCDLALETADAAEMEATEEAEATPEMQSTEEVEPTTDMEATEEAEPEMEATEEADDTTDGESENPVITLSEDCANVVPQLRVAENGTLWIALSVPGEEDWQEFDTPEDEEFNPQFDRRGRFVGCRIPEEGAQVCRITWTQGDVTYVIEIPIAVGDAFVAPQPASSSSSTQTQSSSSNTSSSTGSGEWGACGSCSTCGANANICVTSPDGQCVADPGRCDARQPSSPATTEEP